MAEKFFLMKEEYEVLEYSVRNKAPEGSLTGTSGPSGYGGSTGGIWATDEKGTKWFLKPDPIYPELTTANEMICSHIYHELGYSVPDIALITIKNKRYAAVKFILHKGHVDVSRKINDPQFRQLRVFAAFLKDWDRVHEHTNVLDTGMGHYVLIDFGGCLGGRAQGGHKPGFKVSNEIGCFEKNSNIQQIYEDFNIIMRGTGMPHPAFAAIKPHDIDVAVDKLMHLHDSGIAHAVQSAHYSNRENTTYMIDALVQRSNTIITKLKDYYKRFSEAMPESSPFRGIELKINNSIKGVLYNTEKWLEKNHNNNVEFIDRQLNKKKDVNFAADKFVEYFAYKFFGNVGAKATKEAKAQAMGGVFSILRQHESLLTVMSNVGEIESHFRELVRMQTKLQYDPFTGKNNLSAISGDIVKTINVWLMQLREKHEKDDAFRERLNEVIKERYDNNLNLFARAILFLVFAILMTYITREIITRTEKQISNIKNEVDKIYHGVTVAAEQYRVLKREGLIGNILFRGTNFNPSELEQFIKGGWCPKGSSWTSSWFISIKFAIETYHGVPRETFMSTKKLTFDGFKNKIEEIKKGNRDYHWYTIANVEDMQNIISYAKDRRNGLKVPSMIPVIFSYDILKDKDPGNFFVYVGEHRRDLTNRDTILSESETIFLPEKIEFSNSSVDMFVRLTDFVSNIEPFWGI